MSEHGEETISGRKTLKKVYPSSVNTSAANIGPDAPATIPSYHYSRKVSQ